jgi:surface protein
MLNNKNRDFGNWTSDNEFEGALSNDEFTTQYDEFILGKRELDKFLIRAMAKNNIDITELDTSKIINMSHTFYNLYSFNQDICGKSVAIMNDASNYNSWDVSNVTAMHAMFFNCENFNQDISGWDFSSVKTMAWMLYGAKDFKFDLSNWKINPETNIVFIFDDLTFAEHNTKYKFTSDKLLKYIDKYKNSTTENIDKNKYNLIKYMKQYSQHNNEEFINIIEELNIKLNKDMDIVDAK